VVVLGICHLLLDFQNEVTEMVCFFSCPCNAFVNSCHFLRHLVPLTKVSVPHSFCRCSIYSLPALCWFLDTGCSTEELSRPENKGLEEVVQKLKAVKQKIDEQVSDQFMYRPKERLAFKIQVHCNVASH